MDFCWDANAVRWRWDAAEYTGFYRKLAAVILPLVPHGGTLCDAGCGLGLLGMELAPHFGSVRCVDTSADAIHFVRRAAAGRRIANLEAVQADAGDIGAGWDVVVLAFFGHRKVEHFLPLGKKLVIVMTAADSARLMPAAWRAHRPHAAEAVLRRLKGQGVHCKTACATLEFGQPLAGRADAEAFVRRGAPAIPQAELEHFLQRRLQPLQGERWPLWLPHTKHICVIVAQGGT